MKKLLCALLALLIPACACARTVTIPENTVAIGAEAFKGDGSITEVYIPDDVLSIGTDAFAGCAPALLIRTEADSKAMDYAAVNDIDYQAGTAYRALLIGESEYTTGFVKLEGSSNDADAMSSALGQHETTPYTCYVKKNLTAAEVIAWIRALAKSANPQDVTLFYFSGHGTNKGQLVGTDGKGISPGLLRSELDAIAGRKIVIVDACYSGQLIGKGGASAASLTRDFTSAFVNAFTITSRDNLATDGYYVITAARGTEQSFGFEFKDDRLSYGIFTRHMCAALGWDYLNQQATVLLGDANADGAVTIEEAYQYAKEKAYQEALYGDESQNAQVHPQNCTYQSLIRE